MPHSEQLQWAQIAQQLVTALETINTTLVTMHKDIVVSLETLQNEINSVKEEVSAVKKQVSITSSDVTERLEPIAYSAVEVNKSMPCEFRSFACKLVLMSVTEAAEDMMGRENLRHKVFDSCVFSISPVDTTRPAGPPHW